MLGKLFNFRFRLAAAIFLVAVGATITSLIYYYQMTSAQIWSQMVSRVKDFGKLGVTLLTPADIKYLQTLDSTLNSARGAAALPPGVKGAVISALSEEEKTAIIRTTAYQIIVQKLRRLRFASGKSAAHETILSADHVAEGNEPQIHRVWISGVKMHEITPMHLRVLAADEFEEIDRDNNGRIDPHEKLYCIGDIFAVKQQFAVSAALNGEVAVSNGYRTETSGVFIAGYTPIRDAMGRVVALLVIDFSAATEFDALFRLKVTGYYIIVGVLLLAVMVASATSKLLLKPLEAIQKAAIRIGQRDFSVRIETGSSDELSDLAYAMNLMAQELGEYSTQMERRIAARTREISEMLEALEQGVLTIDRGGIIQAEYSAATLTIFGVKEIAHRRFSELFSDEKLSSAVDRYIEVCFSGQDISAPMLEKANPLRQVTYRNAQGEVRHLRFSFRPLAGETDGEVHRLLVTVVDETYGVTLQEKISLAEAAKRAEFDAIINMMRVPASILDAFMVQQKEFLRDGKQLIGAFGSDRNLLTAFASKTHALKGNALQLGFIPLAERLHELEDHLAQAIKGGENDSRFLRHEISRLINACEGLIVGREKLVARIRELVGEPEQHSEKTELEQLRLFWLNQINRKAAEYSVPAGVEVSFGAGTEQAVQSLHNVIVQLLRNTFAHGLENAEERLERGKPQSLSISLTAIHAGDCVELTYRQDGRGIAGLPSGQTIPLQDILQKGLTSAHKSATLEAGRGLGMEYIASTVAALRGTVTVTTSDQETVFRIAVPV
jgi:HAMP domain-containing protein/HPt (histidine-containing phosphotransfer) domain-containing protein